MFNQDQIDSLVRALVKWGGGVLSAHGFVALSTAVSTPAVAQAVGGIIAALLAQWASHKTHSTNGTNPTAAPSQPISK